MSSLLRVDGPEPIRTLPEPPGKVQHHQKEFPTSVCHMELQLPAELPSQQDICCFGSIRNFPFPLFFCQQSRRPKTEKQESSKGVRRGVINPVRLQGRWDAWSCLSWKTHDQTPLEKKKKVAEQERSHWEC